ncbi:MULTISPECIES: DUF1641 domain-containing protein [Metallosphaera]|uniref:DUF1641 domain-containing protein n=1 Tax=Metallosphaera prunae TaxID=47304 RepID=A0A4D8S2X2_METPR|nr:MULTISPECIES: DUF1641 domain-containing protein [Metallosphaera]MCH1770667.1 DUF1641 domain-containing protein [Metallosphaera sedula]MCP6728865.1 DUF1641 domain-containing protein [Metallosphaera sedula]MCY0861143.1 DUF1641 domain-containing protein [Metallosphaera prunae]QCO31297.1 DUF1641 domain-containing protein [Metallosphaera prunae]WPX06026.1 DUF1641 domain-containing protein [Metallosphaera sedula DSM 5348]
METLEVQTIDKLMSPDNLMTINRVLDLLGTLDRMGILDLVNGALQDEELIGKIMGSIINDNTLSMVTQLNNLGSLMKVFMDKDVADDLQYVFKLLSSLRNSGLMDPIIGMLNDPETLGKVLGSLVNDKTLQLIENWNSTLDLVNAVGNALKQEHKPVKSVIDIYRMMKDPEVQNGLGLLFGIIKELGKIAKTK